MSQQEGTTGSSSNGQLLCPCCGSRIQYAAATGSAREDPVGVSISVPTTAGTMFIDPHAHMISRTTDDYQSMANAGVVAVVEPAFWNGQPRTTVGTYIDYLGSIV